MGLIQLGCYIANKFWWIPWSNFRFRKEERFNAEVAEEHKAQTNQEMALLAREVRSKFEYTKDGADQLWDAVLPPPYGYKQFINNEKYKEDCDGFHSLILHCLHASEIPAYLTVVYARGCSHCVLVYNIDGMWTLLDYTSQYTIASKEENTLDAVVKQYNEAYVKKYSGCKSEVKYNCFIGYNYNKGKFYMANPVKELERKKKENE